MHQVVESSYVNFTAPTKMSKNKGVRDIAHQRRASFLNKHKQADETHCVFILRHLHMFKKKKVIFIKSGKHYHVSTVLVMLSQLLRSLILKSANDK